MRECGMDSVGSEHDRWRNAVYIRVAMNLRVPLDEDISGPEMLSASAKRGVSFISSPDRIFIRRHIR